VQLYETYTPADANSGFGKFYLDNKEDRLQIAYIGLFRSYIKTENWNAVIDLDSKVKITNTGYLKDYYLAAATAYFETADYSKAKTAAEKGLPLRDKNKMVYSKLLFYINYHDFHVKKYQQVVDKLTQDYLKNNVSKYYYWLSKHIMIRARSYYELYKQDKKEETYKKAVADIDSIIDNYPDATDGIKTEANGYKQQFKK
jgi:tetratricopeptide (TPR) repeat protein